jgi:membrane protein
MCFETTQRPFTPKEAALQEAPAKEKKHPRLRINHLLRGLIRLFLVSCTTVWEAYVRFARQHHILYAAAISYYGLISLIPVVAIALSISGSLLGGEESSNAVQELLEAVFPSVPQQAFARATKTLTDTSPWAMALYLFGLVWAGAYLFESIDRVINAIWSGAATRAYHVRKVLSMALVLVVGILLLCSVVAGAAWATLGHAVNIPFERWASASHLVRRLGILAPLFTSVTVFSLLYRFLPTRRVPWRAALVGGVFAGFFWEISKWLFGVFVVRSGNAYGSLYGSLANVVIIMLWIHISAVILIIGAHVGCIVQERVEGRIRQEQGQFWLDN